MIFCAYFGFGWRLLFITICVRARIILQTTNNRFVLSLLSSLVTSCRVKIAIDSKENTHKKTTTNIWRTEQSNRDSLLLTTIDFSAGSAPQESSQKRRAIANSIRFKVTSNYLKENLLFCSIYGQKCSIVAQITNLAQKFSNTILVYECVPVSLSF